MRVVWHLRSAVHEEMRRRARPFTREEGFLAVAPALPPGSALFAIPLEGPA